MAASAPSRLKRVPAVVAGKFRRQSTKAMATSSCLWTTKRRTNKRTRLHASCPVSSEECRGRRLRAPSSGSTDQFGSQSFARVGHCSFDLSISRRTTSDYFFGVPCAFAGLGPVHVQPWINQPLAPFFSTNVMWALSRLATPASVNE